MADHTDLDWDEVLDAWRQATTDGGDDPWQAGPLPTLGAIRAYHVAGEAPMFVASVVSVHTDGLLLTLWIDGHAYLLRHDDFLRLLAHADVD